MLIHENQKEALVELFKVCHKYNIEFSLCGACGELIIGDFDGIPEITVYSDMITYEHPRSGRTEILVELSDIKV